MVTLEMTGRIVVEVDSDTAEDAAEVLREHPELARIVSAEPAEIEEL